MTARAAALDVLIRVMHFDAYANLCIKKTAPKLENDRDRAFFSALVYGVLERRVHLEAALSKLCNMQKLPPEVVEALYMGAYQILFLDGVPQSAAVSESVKLVRRKNPRLSGMVNAVLRNTARQKQALLRADTPLEQVMWELNYPEFLAREWLEVFHEAPAARARRTTGVRVRDLSKRDAVLSMLQARGAQIREFWPGALCVEHAGDLTAQPLYQQGAFVIQSVSSQLIARALGVRRGMRVLDACAAPGGKSFAMADLMEDQGGVTALDLHAHRVNLIREEAARLGIGCIDAQCMDASNLDESFFGAFDAVLVDAPCSGLSADGKPEIALRIQKEDIAALQKTQHDILRRAARCVKDGGALVYSTCTWTREENRDQTARFLKENPDFLAGGLAKRLPADFAAHVREDAYMQLDAQRDGVPSFFMARFVRKNGK